MNFDIQLFADNVQTTASEGLSAEMKTFYDMTLIDEAQANLVHDQFGQKRPIPANGGKIIEFRKFAPLAKATTPLTEGVTPDGKQLSVSTVSAAVSQYGDYITQSDMLELTALDNTILESAKLLGRQAGATLDTVVRNVMQSGTNVMYAEKHSGGSTEEVLSRAELDRDCPITVEMIQRAVAKLRAQNAPTINGKYVGIVHPYVAYDLMRDPEWIDAHKYAQPENLYEGEIGELAGVRFVETTEAKIYAGEDLAADSATLKVNNSGGYSGSVSSIAFDGGTVEENALEGRFILLNGVRARVTGNTANTISIEATDFGTVADNADIYPGEGGAEGLAVFGTLILGDGAYGVTDVNGGGLEIIVKQRGSSGAADPLDQRSSVGWKAIKTAEMLIENYIIRIESVSPRFSATAKAN
ncbi:MAG: N4-gp56 family major capsid protein [Candidatus Limivicinus sp.]|jgi:N4-gp56 family major capsid protein